MRTHLFVAALAASVAATELPVDDDNNIAAAAAAAAAGVPAVKPFAPTAIKAPFLEQFTEDWKTRWIPSSTKKVVDGVEDDELLRYRGEWNVESSQPVVIPGDEGLVVKTAAAHHAISAKFPEPIDPKGKPLIVQYEVKLQNGLECGGAYLKLLSHNASFEPEHFEDKAPYTIMFGPDKCGGTNKVHFIFRHKNPITGEFEEKHLKTPPAAIADKKTNLYTLIVRPDQTFEILINFEQVSSGSLLESFNPPVNPPAEIDDPEDSKPADWVDEAKIVDPAATKPEDWDEEAPLEILDEDAKQPEDWLVDEPLTIADPAAEKPGDWDDEEDGDWCEKVSGCGVWTRPMKKNPAYKGKWSAPLIDNPAYKGVWAPRKIANPSYYHDATPADFNKIGAIGFELWTMQNGIQFDNIYETWAIKSQIEKAAEPKPVEEGEKKDSIMDKIKDASAVVSELGEAIRDQSVEFFARAQQDPVAAVKELPHIAALFAFLLTIPLIVFIVSAASKPAGASRARVVNDEDDEDDEPLNQLKKDAKKDEVKKDDAKKTEGSPKATKRKTAGAKKD
ncbi:Calreticulin family-domain-containing protein [Entophlyctis helioformis]|nr:Calreticulin family-domain-containing protein [Entophlyctis helioformis]